MSKRIPNVLDFHIRANIVLPSNTILFKQIKDISKSETGKSKLDNQLAKEVSR